MDAATGDRTVDRRPAPADGCRRRRDPPRRANGPRRERAREGAGGVVSYATDRSVTAAAFTLGGTTVSCRAALRCLPGTAASWVRSSTPARMRAERRLAYVSGSGAPHRRTRRHESRTRWQRTTKHQLGNSRVHRRRGNGPRHRDTGGRRRGENRRLPGRHLGGPTVGGSLIRPNPSTTNRALLPRRRDANAEVELYVLALDGDPHQDRSGTAAEFPISPSGLVVADRTAADRAVERSERLRRLVGGPAHRHPTELWRDTDPEWVELVPGAPGVCRRPAGTCADRDGARRLHGRRRGGNAARPAGAFDR